MGDRRRNPWAGFGSLMFGLICTVLGIVLLFKQSPPPTAPDPTAPVPTVPAPTSAPTPGPTKPAPIAPAPTPGPVRPYVSAENETRTWSTRDYQHQTVARLIEKTDTSVILEKEDATRVVVPIDRLSKEDLIYLGITPQTSQTGPDSDPATPAPMTGAPVSRERVNPSSPKGQLRSGRK
jgi:hypothetical protein